MVGISQVLALENIFIGLGIKQKNTDFKFETIGNVSY